MNMRNRGAARATILACALAVTASCADLPRPDRFNVSTTLNGADADAARSALNAGEAAVVAFFGEPFREDVRVTIAADRAEFNAAFPPEWGMTSTECWMVGTGVAGFLAVLSPSAWARDACEHNATDPSEFQAIVTHELVHVYHGERNPTGDFTGMDDLGWFVEGVAILVAGQLGDDDRASAADAIAEGAAPTRLAAAWSGKYRYGVSGSMAAYLDAKWGREKTKSLLAAVTQEELLASLGVTEDEFIAGWREWAAR